MSISPYWIAVSTIILVGGGYLAWERTFIAENVSAIAENVSAAQKRIEAKRALLEAENQNMEARIAQQEREYASPDHLKEAAVAKTAQDPKWLEGLGCISAKGGIPVVIIERESFGWQVRLRPPGQEGMTVWGRRFDFRSFDGAYVAE
jgi:hypothetical protein